MFVQPWVKEEQTVFPGVTERRRRSLEGAEVETEPDYENIFKVQSKTTINDRHKHQLTIQHWDLWGREYRR